MSVSQLTGDVKSSTIEGNRVITTFEIPALTSRQAKRRARVNARIKGLDNPEMDEPEMVGQADIPGRKLYEVKVVSVR